MKPFMNKFFLLIYSLCSLSFGASSDPVVLVIHGGIADERKDLSTEQEKEIRTKLEQSLLVGFTAIRKNGSSLDAVVAAIKVLEDSPLFNAGKGAVFTRAGKNELDASIMEGKEQKAGAVASTTTIKNPITAARAVMDKSPHVLIVGPGADSFAKEVGLEIVDPSYFRVEKRWQDLQNFLQAENDKKKAASYQMPRPHWGTVGAVALDSKGNLAAGTSTGGLTGKRPGRVGDSPIIGAGTYADNEGVGVSATGQGEFFIRVGVAHEINSLVKYKNLSLKAATDSVIKDRLTRMGAEGGVIALNKSGEAQFSFNSTGMYRGYITKSGKTHVMIYE